MWKLCYALVFLQCEYNWICEEKCLVLITKGCEALSNQSHDEIGELRVHLNVSMVSELIVPDYGSTLWWFTVPCRSIECLKNRQSFLSCLSSPASRTRSSRSRIRIRVLNYIQCPNINTTISNNNLIYYDSTQFPINNPLFIYLNTCQVVNSLIGLPLTQAPLPSAESPPPAHHRLQSPHWTIPWPQSSLEVAAIQTPVTTTK